MIAQLIKLKDYVSRYEWNAYRYPTQFIRLKQENWDHLYQLWLTQMEETRLQQALDVVDESKLSKMVSFFKKEEIQLDEMNDEETLPKSEKELRHYFLDKLYPLQLKWATSTVTDVSFIDKSYESDAQLKYFLQRFPDIYLIMYYPIFTIKNAPIDGEIIFISPIGIEIIYLLNIDPQSTVIANDDRTWLVETGQRSERKITPLISLKRTERIIQSILKSAQIEFPIAKTVLSKENNIVFLSEPYNTRIVGKFQYEKWFKEKRQLNSTLKNEQLRAAEALLDFCLSTSVRRPEWEDEDIIFTTNDRED